MIAILKGCALVGGMLAALAVAQAQNYPERPIRLVVAFVAGGATDTMTRQITEDLKEALGQPVIVENRPGANGYIAWNYVASADPDGYTLLMAENALAISQGLFKKSASSFDPVTQYDAIAHVATAPLALVVANNVKADSVAELIALSRTVPNKMNYASAGVGTVAHLTFEVFKDGAGMEAVHIPYKGGGQAIGDIIAGQVEMHMASVAVAKPLVEAGRIKALAVKAKLDNAVKTVMAKPQVRERLARLDIEPAYAPGSVLKPKLENEIRNWTKFIDQKGIRTE